MSTSPIQQAAENLRKAAKDKSVCSPVREILGPTDVTSAYQVQRLNHQHRLDEGARRVGYKIGVTSKAAQGRLGVNQPDYGWLFDDKEVLMGSTLPWHELLLPYAEGEIAFVMKKDVPKGRLTIPQLIDAVDYTLGAIEIVGSRISNWDISIVDTIADNASASHFVLGHKPVFLSEVNLRYSEMKLFNNGKLESEGLGKSSMSSPLSALMWLAQTLNSTGDSLKEGDIILSGSLGPKISINPGDHILASLGNMGEIEVFFSN